MKRSYHLILPWLVLGLSATGQQNPGFIRGSIADSAGRPIGYASVVLLRAADSGLVRGALSSPEGSYTFRGVTAGSYFIRGNCTGYRTTSTAVFRLRPGQRLDAGALKMTSGPLSLAAVTIQAKKPLFEQQLDRMIINVKSSPMAASETALDVLEKSPGVQVDRQDQSISVNGKDGVVVMINGKKQYMPMNAFYQLLSSMKAASVDRIELITTPPAKYDAEGNAGYINLVMTSNPRMGFNGSYDLTLSYPYSQVPGADFNFNYRGRRLSLSGNLSFVRLAIKQRWSNYRRFDKSDGILETRTTDNRKAITPYAMAQLSADYQLDTSTAVGVQLEGFNRHWVMNSHSRTTIGPPGVVDTLIRGYNRELNHWQNLTTNLHFDHHFTKTDALTLNANYIYFRDNNPNRYTYGYYDGKDDLLYNTEARSTKVTPIHFWVFSADYEGKISSRLKLETGAKYSVTRFINDIGVYNNGKRQGDLSARYFMKEDIAALYASLSLNLDAKTSLEGGIRYEHTTSNLGTAEQADIVDRKYGSLFPTLYISRKLGDKQQINLAYSRRINRPTLDALAPFAIFLDPTTFMTGNAALQPAISNTAELTYTRGSLLLKAGYTYEAHSISVLPDVDFSHNTQVITPINLRHTQRITVSASLPLTITSGWSMQNNAACDFLRVLGGGAEAAVSRQGFDYSISTIQDFTFPDGYSLEIKGAYYSPRLRGTQKSHGYKMVGLGGSKKFSDQSVLSFAVDNLLGPTSYRASDHAEAEHLYVERQYHFWSRNLSVTYSRSFGNKSLKAQKKWKTGSEEELNRVGQ